MKKENRFDMDRLKPNYLFLVIFIICFVVFVMTTESWLSVILGSIAVVSLGWTFAFGEYLE
ncbi:hypothetical protein LCGC14_1531990 [marine sediment metagenome]|uniref:Uncharacterized protein n=1 Tax=marine sediment metagenome TaxID=412755 RepID=A0A0F9IVU5_9ZZZZ